MNKKKLISYFTNKTIKMCDRCGKFDIKIYVEFELKDDRRCLKIMYSKCPRCGYTKEFVKEEIWQELK